MSNIQISFMISELLAAVSGIIYIMKYREDKSARYFVYFLWLTVIVETVGLVPILIDKNPNFSYLRHTLLAKNSWLYNIHTVVSYITYMYFFSLNVRKYKYSILLKNIAKGFFLFSCLYFFFTNDFFELHSSVIIILGTILLFLSVFIYFLELLNSDEILRVGNILPFYIAFGSIIFHLCVTPIFIFLKFFSTSKFPEFVKLYQMIIPYAIIFMYTCYTIGFIICSRKKKSYLLPTS